jgi:hypothetical protein
MRATCSSWSDIFDLNLCSRSYVAVPKRKYYTSILKDQFIDVVLRNNLWLLRESYEAHEYIFLDKMQNYY